MTATNKRMRIWNSFLVLVALTVAPSAQAESEAGHVVAIDSESYVLDLADEVEVVPGSILQVYRRLPSARGTAAYRSHALWWPVGSLRVINTGEGLGVAVLEAGPKEPLPAGMEESGAAADLIQIGDRVRATGAVGERPTPVRVTFARSALFGTGDIALPESGDALLREWLRGLKTMDGPIEVQVHTRLRELGVEPPDIRRTMSAQQDAPFGPAPGQPTTPVDALYARPTRPHKVAPGRDVLVVDEHDGKPSTWHYTDAVTLARRQGELIASALATKLGRSQDVIRVTVVPRPAVMPSPDVPGYDGTNDQIRILATAIDWAEPPPEKKKKQQQQKKQPEDGKKRKRRLLERTPGEVSLLPPTLRRPEGPVRKG
ncbi:MAG TPA: hypothetical protein DIU15_04125 [Deltaproteobacteria bacterium]|nr:hypothetical protein [Deltaproteobacteria bacterium]HCP45201.1 hypothetical protein [Deltaproteobacteria bacterium]